MISSSEPKRDYKSQSHTAWAEWFSSSVSWVRWIYLPTLFGESEDHTNYEFDGDDFKYSDFFDENGEVYADTLWSSVDHGDMTARDENGCLMYLFDVYTVSTLSSPFGLLTIMSAPPPHHRGARPKTTMSTASVK